MTNESKPPPLDLGDDVISIGAKTVEHAIRFSGLANAGGAISTITVLGATAQNGEVQNILALPLGLFLLGVFLCAMAAYGVMIKYWQKVLGREFKPDPGFRWVPTVVSKVGDLSLFGGLICFLLGAASGVIIVAAA